MATAFLDLDCPPTTHRGTRHDSVLLEGRLLGGGLNSQKRAEEISEVRISGEE